MINALTMMSSCRRESHELVTLASAKWELKLSVFSFDLWVNRCAATRAVENLPLVVMTASPSPTQKLMECLLNVSHGLMGNINGGGDFGRSVFGIHPVAGEYIWGIYASICFWPSWNFCDRCSQFSFMYLLCLGRLLSWQRNKTQWLPIGFM